MQITCIGPREIKKDAAENLLERHSALFIRTT